MGATQDQAPHKPWCFPLESQIGVDGSTKGEQGSEGGVGWEGRAVAINAHLDWAELV
jgi:hypothetical protein